MACAASPQPPPPSPQAARSAELPRPAPAPDPQADLAKKIDPIFSGFTREGAMSPGCAVGVYRAGEIVFSKGYGYADLEHDAPLTDTTPVYTASVSKQFTAAAVLLLAADGKISLDDDVRKYIPELPNLGKRITVEQLLHHTSGLRDYHLLLLLAGLNEEDVITSREVLWLISHQHALNFPPGSHYSYSGSGYVLAAEIVARVSGESFNSFLAKRIFQPLGMTSSLIRDDHAKLIPHRAIGYTAGSDKAPRTLMGNLEYGGSSTLVTTIRDLAKWDANFYDPKVGGQAWLDGMRVRGKLNDGVQLEYAMGLFETTGHGLQVEEHDGAFAGYRSMMLRYPAKRLTVAALCNTTEADAAALSEKVAEVFLPELARPEPAPPAVPPGTFGFDLGAIAGTYIEPSLGAVRTFEASGGIAHLRVGSPPGPPKELVPVGPGDFLLKGQLTHYGYEPAKGKQAARFTRTWPGALPLTFLRTEPFDAAGLTAEKLAEYAGRFGSEELPHDLELRVEGSKLVAGPIGGAARATLAPMARDLFRVEQEDAGWRFERDGRGKIVRVVVSTDRARNVVLGRR